MLSKPYIFCFNQTKDPLSARMADLFGLKGDSWE